MRNGILLLLLMVLSACSTASHEPTPEEQASAVALAAYEALYAGQPETFLDAKVFARQMTPQYAKQLLAACEQHSLNVKLEHCGVSKVTVTRAEADSTLDLMQVFLLLRYGDSTQEEIVVPMVKGQDGWKLE